ncbi:MAG: SRPBCC family protein [Candidatus Omnitrophica bacterium]|nr:SRPBCC family protein [Candidatus Omnitrophota bacterium]
MYHIKSSIRIDAETDAVARVVQDFESYPKFMSRVAQIRTRRNGCETTESDWILDVEGAEVNWTQTEHINGKAGQVLFRMKSGDYHVYEGQWKWLKDTHKGARLYLNFKIDWGLPNLGVFLEPEIRARSRKMIRGFLIGIKAQCEKAAGSRESK